MFWRGSHQLLLQCQNLFRRILERIFCTEFPKDRTTGLEGILESTRREEDDAAQGWCLGLEPVQVVARLKHVIARFRFGHDLATLEGRFALQEVKNFVLAGVRVVVARAPDARRLRTSRNCRPWPSSPPGS
jgi:hypothetical protein